MSKNKIIYNGETLIDLTADTVEADKLLEGATAHDNSGEVITGTCKFDSDTSDATATASQILEGRTAYARGAKLTGTCKFDADTSDATAAASQILEGKTAYIGGKKVTGTMPDNGIVAGKISDKEETFPIPYGYHNGIGRVRIAEAEKAKIIPGNIKAGVEILGVTGDFGGLMDAGQRKTVTPSESRQVVSPDEGFDYLLSVTVNPIPSEYIIPEGTLNVISNGPYDVSRYENVNVNVPEATYLPMLQSKSVTPTESDQRIMPDSGYDGLLSVNVKAIPPEYVIPAGTLEVTENGTHDVKEYENVNVNVPSGTDTSDATAGEYDIYYDTTAYVKGVKVTGKYRMSTSLNGAQYNAGSAGCSTRQLIIPCEYTPIWVTVVLNSPTYTNNTVIAMWSGLTSAVVYHTKTSSGVARTQLTSGTSDYIYYDSANKQIVINSPSTSYLWSAQNYRVFAFR